MILQTLNIVGGVILASDKIGEAIGKEKVAKIETAVAPYRSKIGIVIFILGILGLIERLSIVYFGIPNFGSSFPQTISAIVIGLLLGAPFFSKFPQVQTLTTKLTPYSSWIGIAAIAVGLGSMLFGCMSPICYPLYF